jgi:hypothetical protein
MIITNEFNMNEQFQLETMETLSKKIISYLNKYERFCKKYNMKGYKWYNKYQYNLSLMSKK